MKKFLESLNLEIAESDIFYVKRGVDDDGAMEKWLWFLFVELWAFLSSKLSSKMGLKNHLIP